MSLRNTSVASVSYLLCDALTSTQHILRSKVCYVCTYMCSVCVCVCCGNTPRSLHAHTCWQVLLNAQCFAFVQTQRFGLPIPVELKQHVSHVLFLSLVPGRRLNVHIEIQCDPQIVAVYENAIKVTADGPREPRSELRAVQSCIILP